MSSRALATKVGKGTVLAGGRTAATVAFQDRRVEWRAIDCPECKVPPGSPCHSTKGAAKSAPHVSRRRMALRAETRDYDAADVAYCRSMLASERRVTRKQNGLGQAELADLLGIDRLKFGKWERGECLPSDAPFVAAYGQWLREHRDVVA